jgi:hypothetical protein
MTNVEKLKKLTEHINLVRMYCEKLGWKLIESGDEALGIEVIARGYRHDISKFKGDEWDYLWPDVNPEKLASAIHYHAFSNDHHPEYWYGIKNMPRRAIAEMVCDWKARATEFGTGLIDWIDREATKRFFFTKEDPVYNIIMEFVHLLCEKPFANRVKEIV